ncbi:MAG: hypothetical protein U1F25_12455 [Rubrivivax sp.]
MPAAWLEQLAPGGRLVAPVPRSSARGAGAGGRRARGRPAARGASRERSGSSSLLKSGAE